MRIPSFRSVSSLLLAISLTGTAAFAGGALTKDIKGGGASLTLTPQLTAILAFAQIKFIKVAPGSVIPAKGKLTLPVTGGALDTVTAKAEISSGGGFKFTKDTLEVSAIDYAVTIASGQGTVSALITVNGVLLGRTELATFQVTIPTPVTVPKNNKVKLDGLSLTLSSAAATALNNAFSTNVFAQGQNLGQYDVTVVLAPKPL